MPWLAEHYPELVPRYEAMYAKPYASVAERKRAGSTVAGLVRALGGIRATPRTPRRWRARDDEEGGSAAEQLTLV